MTPRDLMIRALQHEQVERTPRDIWVLSGVAAVRAHQVQEIAARFPSDVVHVDFRYPRGRRSKGKPMQVGRYTDAWGCTWEVRQRGAHREMATAPLRDAAAMESYRPPMELIEEADLAGVARQCSEESRFMLAWTETRLLDRLRLLRGSRAALSELAQGRKAIVRLLDSIHEFCCREMRLWGQSDVDGVVFGDELAEEQGLLLDPDIWRELFRPRYAEYVRILQEHDKFALFQCPGDISCIWNDLIETGVDAIRADLGLLDEAALSARSRGRVALWGGLDVGDRLEAITPETIRHRVREFRRQVDYGRGGVIAQCTWSVNVPLKHLLTFLDQWAQPVPVHF